MDCQISFAKRNLSILNSLLNRFSIYYRNIIKSSELLGECIKCNNYLKPIIVN